MICLAFAGSSADPRSRTLASDFVFQWLEMKKLDEIVPDRDVFPYASGFMDPRQDFRTELTLFADSVESTGYAPRSRRLSRMFQRQAFELELEQARYEARLAARRYDAVDPDQRLVAAELEVRWNAALQKVRELEDKLQEFDLGIKSVTMLNKEVLLSLAQDLPAVWNSPSTEATNRTYSDPGNCR